MPSDRKISMPPLRRSKENLARAQAKSSLIDSIGSLREHLENHSRTKTLSEPLLQQLFDAIKGEEDSYTKFALVMTNNAH